MARERRSTGAHPPAPIKPNDRKNTTPTKTTRASRLIATTSEEDQVSFHLFPKFPVELRLKIWSHALPSHQIIKIKKPRTDANHEKKSLWGFRINPSMLHACQESRSVALRAAQPSFKAHLKHPVIFSSEMDALWMEDLGVLDEFFSATKFPPTVEVTTVRVLVIDPLRLYPFSASIHLPEPAPALRQAVSRFGALEKVIILRSDGSRGSEWDYKLQFGNPTFPDYLKGALNSWKDWYAQQSSETWKKERQVTGPNVTIMTEKELEAWVE